MWSKTFSTQLEKNKNLIYKDTADLIERTLLNIQGKHQAILRDYYVELYHEMRNFINDIRKHVFSNIFTRVKLQFLNSDQVNNLNSISRIFSSEKAGIITDEIFFKKFSAFIQFLDNLNGCPNCSKEIKARITLWQDINIIIKSITNITDIHLCLDKKMSFDSYFHYLEYHNNQMPDILQHVITLQNKKIFEHDGEQIIKAMLYLENYKEKYSLIVGREKLIRGYLTKVQELSRRPEVYEKLMAVIMSVETMLEKDLKVLDRTVKKVYDFILRKHAQEIRKNINAAFVPFIIKTVQKYFQKKEALIVEHIKIEDIENMITNKISSKHKVYHYLGQLINQMEKVTENLIKIISEIDENLSPVIHFLNDSRQFLEEIIEDLRMKSLGYINDGDLSKQNLYDYLHNEFRGQLNSCRGFVELTQHYLKEVLSEQISEKKHNKADEDKTITNLLDVYAFVHEFVNALEISE